MEKLVKLAAKQGLQKGLFPNDNRRINSVRIMELSIERGFIVHYKDYAGGNKTE